MALIDNYLKLITSQHMNQPKYREMLESLLRYSDDIFSLVVTLDDEFDVELATGIQEDILGCLVGINRNLNFQPEKDLSSVLDNAAYRTLLLAKIAQNMWTGGILDLRELWYSLFGSGIIIQDNQNMTIDVIIVGEFITQIIKNAIKENIIGNTVSSDAQLPSVRQLSKELGVSILTVKKAYDELEREGFIVIRQGLGTFVATMNQDLLRDEKQKDIEAHLLEACKIAKTINLSKSELTELFNYIYEEGTEDE